MDWTDQQLPFRVKQFTYLSELKIGDILLAQAETVGPCANCHDPDGRLWFHRLLPGGGRIHWITDAAGDRRMYYAELISAPCPVCRPWRQAPKLPDLPNIGEEIPEAWDWTI